MLVVLIKDQIQKRSHINASFTDLGTFFIEYLMIVF